jgi:hypothetical protein
MGQGLAKEQERIVKHCFQHRSDSFVDAIDHYEVNDNTAEKYARLSYVIVLKEK